MTRLSSFSPRDDKINHCLVEHNSDPLADKTLSEIADDVKNATEEASDSEDSNNDGISDYYTKLLCNGELRDGAGRKVFGDATYEEVQANDDYDDDELKNGEEVMVAFTGGKVYVAVFSSPIKKDSDGDELWDKDNQKPRVGFKWFELVSRLSHIPENKEIEKIGAESEASFSTIPRVNVIINQNYYLDIYHRAVGNIGGGKNFKNYPHAAEFLSHFLIGEGKDLVFDAEEAINTSNGQINFANNLNDMIQCVEDNLKNNSQMYLSTPTVFEGAKINSLNPDIDFERNTNKRKMAATSLSSYGAAKDDLSGNDWWYAIGDSTAAMVGRCDKLRL